MTPIHCLVILTEYLELLSPRHVTDSLKATFRKRPGKKHIYQQCMMVAMLLSMMAGSGEMYCQFMYTKRMFQWEMDQETVSLEKLHIRAFILQLLSTIYIRIK